MIRRLLALFGFALVSRSDAELLAGVKGCAACMVHHLPLANGSALYVVVGIREATDEEFMNAIGIKEH